MKYKHLPDKMKYKRGDFIKYDIEPDSYWAQLNYDQDIGVVLEQKDREVLVRWATQRGTEEMTTWICASELIKCGIKWAHVGKSGNGDGA